MIRFELIFVILAGIFLGTLILNEKETNMSTSETLVVSQLGINAVSIANSYIQRISNPALAFDDSLVANAVQPNAADMVSKLSILSLYLGRDAGETSQSQFNDVDDWNNLDTMVTIDNVGSFHVLCYVSYWDPIASAKVSTRQWYKLVEVAVADTVPNSPATHFFQFNDQRAEIREQFVVSYYKFLR